MRGRGWWFGWGPGMGRGMGFGRGMDMGRGIGLGRGNLNPFCRFYPWLPRRWWAYSGGYHPTAQPGVYAGGPYYGPRAPYPWW